MKNFSECTTGNFIINFKKKYLQLKNNTLFKMKKKLFLFSLFCFSFYAKSQKETKSYPTKLMLELATNACNCIDSIETYNKAIKNITADINACINKQAGAFQLGSKLLNIDTAKEKAETKDGKKQINISFETNENSAEYKKYYYILERYLMDNCSSLQNKIASNEKQSVKSISNNDEAKDYFNKGQDEAKIENYQKAIDYFNKAVKIDPEFAFAWDNLGVNYRKLNQYDKAIESYKKSLEIDPNGSMPLQNIAVVYIYKKEYQNAIKAYEKLAERDKTNPEIYYGLGNVYAMYLQDYEKGLDNLCKAYNLYIEQKSPYRTDAEKLINAIYSEMKKQGKEAKFNEILAANKINRN